MSQFILSGFSDEISADFEVQLNEMANLGIAYIEIRGVNGKSVVEHSIEEMDVIKNQMATKGIQVSAIGSPIGKIQITDDFEPHFKLFQHTIEIAKKLGTSYIRMFSFFMEAGSAAGHRDEVLRRLKLMVEVAEQEGITLLHENEKDIYGDTPERCLDLYRSMNSNNFKLIFDPANFIQCGVKAYPDAFDLLKEHVSYYHIKDAIMATGKVVPAGKGDGHIAEIIQALNARAYEGFLSLEPHLGAFIGFSDLEGDSHVPEIKETSDMSKFTLAYDSLMTIINNGGYNG